MILIFCPMCKLSCNPDLGWGDWIRGCIFISYPPGQNWQTPFSNAFSWMEMIKFRFKFHRYIFPGVHLTVCHHRFKKWLGAEQATRHYLNQWWPSALTHIRDTRGRWILTAYLTNENYAINWYCSGCQMINICSIVLMPLLTIHSMIYCFI